LGAVAVIGSGIVYMLQGLDTIDLQLRNWAFLTLMLVLALGGIFSFSLLEDRKGARLFFTLAALVVPVQFSQLGGMVFDHFGGGAGNLLTVFQFTSVSNETLWLTLGLSMIAALVVSIASFSILSRPHARWLTVSFILSNLLLLAPIRALPLGLITLGLMLAIIFQLERKIFSRDIIFKTFEGYGARILCSIPLIIAFVRSAFHQDEIAGLWVLSGLFAFMLAQLCVRWLANGRIKESVLFTSWIIGAVSSFGIADYLIFISNFSSEFHSLATILIATLPFIAWTFYLAYLSKAFNQLYRLVAILASVTLTLMVFKVASVPAMLTAGAIGVSMVTWGFVERARLPIILGALVVAGSVIGLIAIGIQHVEVNVWLGLAISGVVLVALSSVAEKFGRRWLDQSRASLENFSNWPA